MSYQDLLNFPYAQPDITQLFGTSASQPRVTGGVPQYPQTNSYDFHDLMKSPWVKQYRSMCAELGRNVLLSPDKEKARFGFPSTTNSHKPVARIAHSNSVGHKVVSFLRGAFRRGTDDSASEDCTIRRTQTERRTGTMKQVKKVECLLSQKSWRSPTNWMSRRKEHRDETMGSPMDKRSTTSKQLIAIRHSGSRSADNFRKHIVPSECRTRESASVPLDQSNSQNSTPTPRPSALITARSGADKSREGAAKRTRFSLHPSTCNAPPDLIRPRRDSDDTANSLSSLVDTSTRSAKTASLVLKGISSPENADKRLEGGLSTPTSIGDTNIYDFRRENKPPDQSPTNSARLPPTSKMESTENSSTVSITKRNQLPIKSSLKHSESNEVLISSGEETQPNNVQLRSGVLKQSQGRSCIASKSTYAPVVPVTPMAKILPRRVSSSNAVSERKHVTFEPPVSQSLPSTPVLNTDSLTPFVTPITDEAHGTGQIKKYGVPYRSASVECERQDWITDLVRKPSDSSSSLPVLTEKPPRPAQLNNGRAPQLSIMNKKLGNCRASKRKFCRFKRYRKLIADLNQIYHNYAAPYDFVREFIDEICQTEVKQIVRMLLTEKGLTKESDPMTGFHEAAAASKEVTQSKLANTGNQKDNVRSCIPARTTSSRFTQHLESNEHSKSRSVQNLDEWLGLKPSRYNGEGRSVLMSRIVTDTDSENRRANELLDMFPTKDFGNSFPRRPYNVQSSIPVSRADSLPQDWMNPHLRGLRRSLSSMSRKQPQQTFPGCQVGRYAVQKMALRTEEAQQLESRPQHLFATLEDNLSSELEFSDERSAIQSDTQSRKIIPSTHRINSQQEDKCPAVRTSERPLTCHSTQTMQQYVELDNPQVQVSFGDGSRERNSPVDRYLPTGPSSSETVFIDHTRKSCTPIGTESTRVHVSTASVLPGQTAEQKKADNVTVSDETSAAHLWNQIHQSLVELSSISDEGLHTAPQHATATVRLERSVSAMARSDTVDSLSPCLSKLGATLTELNADLTGFSEPSISTISLPDDVSSVPWTRARIVVLRDATTAPGAATATSSAILIRCQMTNTASQTEEQSDQMHTSSPGKMQQGETRSESHVRTPCACQDRVSSCPCSQPNHGSPCCSCNQRDVIDNGKECRRCSPQSCASTSRPVSVSTQVAVQTDTELTTSMSTPAPNDSVTLSPILCGGQTGKSSAGSLNPVTDSTVKSLLEPPVSVESGLQVGDVGDCAHRLEEGAPLTTSCESGELSKPKSFIPTTRLIPYVKPQSQVSVLKSTTHPSNKHSSTSSALTELLTAHRPGRPERALHQRPNSRLLHVPRDAEVSSGDSRFTQTSPLKPKWNVGLVRSKGHAIHGHRLRTLAYHDTDTDVSDADASSSISLPRRSHSRTTYRSRQIELGRRFPGSDSKSQPPSFELLRLENRHSQMPCLPVRYGMRLTDSYDHLGDDRKMRHAPLTELREMKRHRSVPHLSRAPSTHVPVVSAPRSRTTRNCPFYTPPATHAQQQQQPHKRLSSTRQWDIDSSHTDSESGTLCSSGYRRVNRRKVQSVRSYPTASLDSSHKARSVGSTSVRTPLPSLHHPSEGLSVRTDINVRRRLVKRSSRAEASRGQISPTTATHLQGPSWQPHTSMSVQREPLRRNAGINRTVRSIRKVEPLFSHMPELRPVDDNLLRHTFASLQKVRTKVHTTVPSATSRPPMIFKR